MSCCQWPWGPTEEPPPESGTFGHICVQPRRKIQKKRDKTTQAAILIGAINYTRLTLTVSVLLSPLSLYLPPSVSFTHPSPSHSFPIERRCRVSMTKWHISLRLSVKSRDNFGRRTRNVPPRRQQQQKSIRKVEKIPKQRSQLRI